MKKILVILLALAACARRYDSRRPSPLAGEKRAPAVDIVALDQRVRPTIVPVEKIELEKKPAQIQPQKVEVQPPVQKAEPPEAKPAPIRDNTLRIAVLLPMESPIAKDLRDAAQLALFNLRSDSLVLQFYDSKGTEDGAREAAAKAVKDKADAFVGPLFKDEVEGAKKESAGRPVISFTTDAAALSRDVFSIGFMLDDQVRHIMDYAASNSLSRLAIITPNSPSGKAVRRAVRDSARDVEIVADE
ncbi:MAG: ABC transporter substrate-binding protein, partial [Rickettsiales bacterium]|nr:ABC transporter substrate-binding protein [Rickettsiales bacterium]